MRYSTAIDECDDELTYIKKMLEYEASPLYIIEIL